MTDAPEPEAPAVTDPVDAAMEEIFGPLATLAGRTTIVLGAGGWTCLTLGATVETPLAADALFTFGKVAIVGAFSALVCWLISSQAAGRFDGKFRSFGTVMRGHRPTSRKALFALAVFLMLLPTLALLGAPATVLFGVAIGASNRVPQRLVCEKAISTGTSAGKPAGVDIDGMCARVGMDIGVRPWCKDTPEACAPTR